MSTTRVSIKAARQPLVDVDSVDLLQHGTLLTALSFPFETWPGAIIEQVRKGLLCSGIEIENIEASS